MGDVGRCTIFFSDSKSVKRKLISNKGRLKIFQVHLLLQHYFQICSPAIGIHMHIFFFKEEYEILNVLKDFLSNTSDMHQMQILPKNESGSQIRLSDGFLCLHRC